MDRQTARLVPAQSSDAIVDAISALIQSPVDRLSLAVAGAEFIRANFNWDINTDSLIKQISEWRKTQ
jgi:hypothetical protein